MTIHEHRKSLDNWTHYTFPRDDEMKDAIISGIHAGLLIVFMLVLFAGAALSGVK